MDLVGEGAPGDAQILRKNLLRGYDLGLGGLVLVCKLKEISIEI